MLTPAAHVPGVLVGEVPVDAGRLLLALAEPGDRLTLLLSCADPSLAQLDAGAVDALIVGQCVVADPEIASGFAHDAPPSPPGAVPRRLTNPNSTPTVLPMRPVLIRS